MRASRSRTTASTFPPSVRLPSMRARPRLALRSPWKRAARWWSTGASWSRRRTAPVSRWKDLKVLATTAEVDEIRKDAGQRELRLYIDVDRGEWLLPRAVWLLQEKLNAYASFILDGKMRELYPWAHPRDVRIVIRSRGQPPQDALRLVGLVRETLEKDGPRVEFEQVA